MTQTRKQLVLKHLADGEWKDGYVLCHPSIGGSEGLRRLRELRDEGHQINKRRKPGYDSFQYQLERGPSDGSPFVACSCEWDGRGAGWWTLNHRDPDCVVTHASVVRK